MKRLLLLLLTFIFALIVPASLNATWARVSQTTVYCGSSTAACVVTVPTVVAGHLLVMSAEYVGSTVTIASATGLGTWVHPSSCQANSSGYGAIDWIYNLNATAGTSVSITMSATTATYMTINFMEYSGASPFAFDVCGTLSSGTSYTAPPSAAITTTGANDLAIAIVDGDQTIAAGSVVSPSPWSTPILLPSSADDYALADALNIAPQTTHAVFTAAVASYTIGGAISFSDTTSGSAFVRKRVLAKWTKSDGMAATATGVTGTGGTTGLTMEAQIAGDMFVGSTSTLIANEEDPAGVPTSYDFYSHAVIEEGNDPTIGGTVTQDAVVGWFTLYVPVSPTNTATNTMVNIRNCRLTYLNSRTLTWSTPVTAALVAGDIDVEDYTTDFSGGPYADNVRTETDGSVSVSPASGDVSHGYWPYPRMTIIDTQVAGVLSVCEARLIVNNPALTDDRASAHYIFNQGADYYPANTGNGIANNPSVGGSKFKIMTNNWTSVAMTTIPLATLNAYPPPISLSGDAP